jgi:hypothetical protein
MERRTVVLVAGSVVVLGVATVVAVPALFGDRIVEQVVATLGEELDVKVNASGGTFSLLSDFPLASVTLTDLTVASAPPFEGEPLASIGALEVSVAPLALLSGRVDVRGLAVRDATFVAQVDETGAASWDGLGGADDAPAQAEDDDSAMSLSIQDIVLERVAVRYDDLEAGTHVEVTSIDLEGEVDDNASHSQFAVDGALTGVTVEDGGVAWLSGATVGANGEVEVDAATGRIEMGENVVSLNDLKASISGTATPKGDDWDLALALGTEGMSFKSLLSVVPALYAKDFAGLSAEGQLSLSGTVNGVLPAEGEDLPAFDMKLGVKDGSFRYPDLPSDVSDVQVAAHLVHPGGDPDGIVVDVSRFHLVMAGAPVDGRIKVAHATTDPSLDMAVQGKLDLGTLAQVVPPDPGTSMTGTLDLDLLLKGQVSAFEAQDLDAIEAGGSIQLLNVVYKDEELPEDFRIERMTVGLSPRSFDMAELQVRFGDSDLHAKGRVDNAIAYALTDAPLVGVLNMDAHMLDLRPYMAGDEEDGAAADDGESSLVAVPDNLDLEINLKADKVLAYDYDLRNVSGQLRVADRTVQLDRVTADTLGGDVKLSGTYKAPTDQKADVDLDVAMRTMDLRQTFETVNTLARMAPVAKGASGRFSMNFQAQASLGPTLEPALPTLMSSGSVGTQSVTVVPAFLALVSSQLGGKALKALSLDDSLMGFSMKKGLMNLKKTPVRMGDVKGTIGGGVGVVDKTLDLRLGMKVPAKGLKSGALGDIGEAVAKNGKVPVAVTVTGPWAKPKVRLDLGDLGDNVKDAVIDEVQGGVDKAVAAAAAAGDQLIAEAQKQADKLVAEAKKQAERLNTEANKQAKKLVKNAKGNPVKELAAKEGAKQIRKKAKKAGDKLVSEARKASKKVVAKAEDKKDELVSKAEAKSQIKK